MFKVTNTSASHISLSGKNLAPGQTISMDAIPLALRSLEEIKALKIEQVDETNPTVVVDTPKKKKSF